MKPSLLDLQAYLVRLQGVYTTMKIGGIRLDAPYAEKKSWSLAHEESVLVDQMRALTWDEFNPNSVKQVARALYYGEPFALPVRRWTEKHAASTDADTLLVLLEEYPDNPFVRALLRQRKLAKYNGTYFKGFLDRMDKQGYVHPNFNLYGTTTGRPSSSDPNLYNVPSRGAEAKEVKAMLVGDQASLGALHAARDEWGRGHYDNAAALMAANGAHVVHQVDYSQAELRVLGHLSGDAALLRAYREDLDVHHDTAAFVWPGREKEMRRLAKVGNFLMAYMGSAPTLAEGVWNSYDEEERADLILAHGSKEAAYAHTLATMSEFRDGWLKRYSGVAGYWKATIEEAFRAGELVTPFGRRRRVGMIPHPGRAQQQYEDLKRTLVNFPVQSFAADLTQEAMVRLVERTGHLRGRPILMLYDSIWSSVHPGDVVEWDRIAHEVMAEVPVQYGIDSLPFKAESEVGLDAAYTTTLQKWEAAHG